MWSIHYASLSAMFNPLHSSTNWELFGKHLYNQNSLYENADGATHQLSYEFLKVKYPLCFCYVQPVTQQYKSRDDQRYLYHQSSLYEKYRQFPSHKGNHYMLPSNWYVIAVNKGKWDTMEDIGKPMKNTLCVILWLKQRWTVKN